VLFLCPHNAAKSVLAAAYFDRLAGERGLPYRADSAGTEPVEGPAPAVVSALQAEGVDVSGYRPRHVESRDLAGAYRVVSMGCDQTDLQRTAGRIERWDDIPPVSQDLEVAYAAIRRHVETLIADLEHDGLKHRGEGSNDRDTAGRDGSGG
jgi:protein-tyrosine-phosphatase